MEPPFNLALVNVTHNTAEYRWEVGNTACGNRSNITGFARSLDDQSPLQTTNGIQTTDTVTGLQPNTQHRVTVRVMCEGGGGVAVSDFSFPLNFTTREFGKFTSPKNHPKHIISVVERSECSTNLVYLLLYTTTHVHHIRIMCVH